MRISYWAFPTNVFVEVLSYLLSFLLLSRTKRLLRNPKRALGIRFLGKKSKQYLDIIAFLLFVGMVLRLGPVAISKDPNSIFSGVITMGMPLAIKFSLYNGALLTIYLCLIAIMLVQLLVYWKTQKYTTRLRHFCLSERPYSLLYDDKKLYVNDASVFLECMKRNGLDEPNKIWFDDDERRWLMEVYDSLRDSIGYFRLEEPGATNVCVGQNPHDVPK